MMYVEYIKTPAGEVQITADESGLLSILFSKTTGRENPNEWTRLCAAQLSEYFSGERTSFDLPLTTKGTPFQRRVWAALRDIPYGQTRSYADIAESVGSPKGVRAVGGANKRNAFVIVVPCHRVIRKDGSIGGYGGGVSRKEFLLAHESANQSRGGRGMRG